MLSFEETLNKVINQHQSIESKLNNNDNSLNNGFKINSIYQVPSSSVELKNQIQMLKGYKKYNL